MTYVYTADYLGSRQWLHLARLRLCILVNHVYMIFLSRGKNVNCILAVAGESSVCMYVLYIWLKRWKIDY